MKKIVTLLMGSLCLLFAAGTVNGFAATNEELEKRIEELETKSKESPLGRISENIKFFGAIEVDYSWADDADTSDRNANDSTSDLDVGTVELGIEAALHEYLTATAVIKGENLDSDDKIFWDQAFFEIKKDGIPVYLVAGKTYQPFGVFESLFINDPITCDLYEINDTGITVGFTHEAALNLDLSVTVYRGETLIKRVSEAGYGWSRNHTAGYTETNDVESYILSGSIEPMEGLAFSLFFNSEPGDTDRNNTMGASAHFEKAGFIADAEYIGALQREKHVADDKEYKESAWFISLGYQVLDPLLLAIRYESFDADKSAAENLENRYSIGATYTLLEKDDFVCSLMGEYRKTEFETTSGSTNDDEVDEFFARIAIEF